MGTGSVQSNPDELIKGVEGPNEDSGNTTLNGTAGAADLSALAGFDTFDAAVLGFDFVPQGPIAEFRYVFASMNTSSTPTLPTTTSSRSL